jgi:LPS-assembly lipoprotein
MKKNVHLIFYIALACMLCQCGFHLRGITTLPPSFQHVYIEAPPESRFLQSEITNQLQAYHVLLSSHQKDAHFKILINKVDFRRQISNISSSTTPRQFQLFYDVYFELIDSHQTHTIIPQGKITSTRLVSMNSERLLGSNYEQDFFLHEMQAESAAKIVSAIGHYFNLHHNEAI